MELIIRALMIIVGGFVIALGLVIMYNLALNILKDYRDKLGERPREYYDREEQFKQRK